MAPTDPDPTHPVATDPGLDRAGIRDRIETLAARAARDRAAFEPPADPPDEARAMDYLRTGAGQAVGLYIHARSGGRLVAFTEEEWTALEDAMNTWFELYAACYGESIDPAVPVRTAAEALLETHNIHDVARVLTHVPRRPDRPDRATS